VESRENSSGPARVNAGTVSCPTCWAGPGRSCRIAARFKPYATAHAARVRLAQRLSEQGNEESTTEERIEQ